MPQGAQDVARLHRRMELPAGLGLSSVPSVVHPLCPVTPPPAGSVRRVAEQE